MPLFNRDAAERSAGKDLRRHLLDARGRWERELKKRKYIASRLPAGFTDAERDLLAAIIFRRMLETARASARDVADELEIDRAVVDAAGSRVIDRMKKAARATASGVIGETVSKLKQARTDNPATRRNAFDTAFGAPRAESIAITTTTAANSSGQLAVGLMLGDEVEITYLWMTEDDGHECPICGALHEKGEDVWGAKFPSGPPAHPRCRCRLRAKMRDKRRRG